MSRFSYSAAFLLAFCALVGLQWFPYTGIFLMMVGAAFWAGLLVHAFLIALAFDAWYRRVPRFLIAVPVLAYVGYYAAYTAQSAQIAMKSADLRAANPGKVIDFDPARYALVMKDAHSFVGEHEIPVTYDANPNYPEKYLSHRVLTHDRCQIPRDSQGRIHTFGFHHEGKFQSHLCLLRFPETPPPPLLTVTVQGYDDQWKDRATLTEQTTELALDGVVIARYRTATAWRLHPLPLGYVGCAFISSSPRWACTAGFSRNRKVLDGTPAGIDATRYDTPVSVMLGVRRYTADDLKNFRMFAQNEPALALLAGEPARVEDQMFAALRAIIEGQNPKPPHNLGYSVALNAARLAPFAEGMAERFVALNQETERLTPNRQDQIEALAGGLGALPPEAFARVTEKLESVILKDRSWDRYSVLYLRMADAGEKTAPFYKQDFMTGKLPPYLRALPVLALCRIGKADDETITELKRRFLGDEPNHNETKSAYLVALMKFGEGTFLRENLRAMSSRLQGWAEAVLDGNANTGTGPNNCIGAEWGNTTFVPAAMRPVLERQAASGSAA